MARKCIKCGQVCDHLNKLCLYFIRKSWDIELILSFNYIGFWMFAFTVLLNKVEEHRYFLLLLYAIIGLCFFSLYVFLWRIFTILLYSAAESLKQPAMVFQPHYAYW